MDKLIKYLQKLNINQCKPNHDFNVCYEVQTCGSDYFMEAPNFFYNRVVVYMEYNVDAGKEYFMKLNVIEKMLKSYCNKYFYKCERTITSYGLVYFIITSIADYEKAEYYYNFAEACRNEFFRIDHKYHMEGKTNFSNQAAIILNRIYSLRYRQFLKATEA